MVYYLIVPCTLHVEVNYDLFLQPKINIPFLVRTQSLIIIAIIRNIPTVRIETMLVIGIIVKILHRPRIRMITIMITEFKKALRSRQVCI